jgi:hypothetical protein
MNKEDSLQFMQERLGQQHSASCSDFQLHAMPHVLRSFKIELDQDESHLFEHVDEGFTVRCIRGGVWVSHENGITDAILITGETYCVEREDALYLYALTPAALEIEFEDQVTQH